MSSWDLCYFAKYAQSYSDFLTSASFGIASGYLADIPDPLHLMPWSVLQHALISSHLPHQNGVNPTEGAFSQLGRECLSPLSWSIQLSPLRSGPAASLPMKVSHNPKAGIHLTIASTYCFAWNS